MKNIIERKKALEAVLQQKMNQLQQAEAVRNSLTTNIVQLQGKLELLKELELEFSETNKKEESKKDSA